MLFTFLTLNAAIVLHPSPAFPGSRCVCERILGFTIAGNPTLPYTLIADAYMENDGASSKFAGEGRSVGEGFVAQIRLRKKGPDQNA